MTWPEVALVPNNFTQHTISPVLSDHHTQFYTFDSLTHSVGESEQVAAWLGLNQNSYSECQDRKVKFPYLHFSWILTDFLWKNWIKKNQCLSTSSWMSGIILKASLGIQSIIILQMMSLFYTTGMAARKCSNSLRNKTHGPLKCIGNHHSCV